MAQPILVGLIMAMGTLAAAIFTLIGVLWNTNSQFKLGKRTGDIAQQTVEDNRAKELGVENKGLREEIKLLRKEAWDTEQGLRQEIKEERRKVAELEDTAAGVTAQLNVALRAQERAEGGLVATERTIASIYSPPEQRQEAP